MLLANRVAIITGGAKGIGRSTAIKFAEEGCDIAIVDISMMEANETVNQVEKRGREGLAIECDITDGKKVHGTVNQVINKFGKVDILVNTAGGTGEVKSPDLLGIANITEEEWDRVVAVNLKGAFLFCKEVVPYMKERKYGKIINFSSLGWIDPPANSPHYHAAKAGIVGLTNDMACELSPHNIYVNAILPGPIRTPFYDKVLATRTEQEKDAFFKGIGKTVPLQRVGTSEDVAGVALFLASELSSFVAGASIPVGGGIPLRPSLFQAMSRKGQL